MKRRPMHERPEHHPEFDHAVKRFFHTTPAADVLERYNALGLGLGYKVTAGKVSDTLSLRVFVPAKTEDGKAPKNAERVGPVIVVPTEHGDELRLPTDVECSGIAVVHSPTAPVVPGFVPTDPFEVLVGGVQISTRDRRTVGVGVGRGTLGGWAWDKQHRRVVLISNAHVLGQHDARANVVITQPSNPHTARKIAELSGSAGYFGDEEHTVDAAIGARLRMAGVNMTVHAIGPAIMATAEPVRWTGVEKVGVTTGHTRGRIANDHWMGYIATGAIGGKASERKLFRACMRIRSSRGQWADHGDSGALVFASQPLRGSAVKPVVGLHFAGEDKNPRIGFACRIHEVFRALGLTSLSEGALSIVLSAMPLDETGEERARTALAAFFAGVPASGHARALHDVIVKRGAELTDMVINDGRGALRRRATNMLRPIVGNGQTLDDVCATTLADPLVDAIDECCTAFAERASSAELATALRSLQTLVDHNKGRTLAETFAYARPSVDSGAPSDVSRVPVTLDDVIAYLDTHAQTDLLDRFAAVGAEPYQHSRTSHGIELTRDRTKPGAPKLPRVVEWNRDGRQLQIPLRERAGRIGVKH